MILKVEVREQESNKLKDDALEISASHKLLSKLNGWDFDRGPYKYNKVMFKTRIDAAESELVFDTVAFLCNDTGKTIEKITGS